MKQEARAHSDPEGDQSLKRLLQYFEDNEQRLRYDGAGKEGLPISLGCVESAALHTVQQRMKQSGMRWSDEGAQSIHNLWMLYLNGEFEQYWEDFAAAGF